MCDLKLKIRLCQSMRIYIKNIPAKFRPDQIWNDGGFGFFMKTNKNNNNNNKMSNE